MRSLVKRLGMGLPNNLLPESGGHSRLRIVTGADGLTITTNSHHDLNARDSRYLNSLVLAISTRVRVSECTRLGFIGYRCE